MAHMNSKPTTDWFRYFDIQILDLHSTLQYQRCEQLKYKEKVFTCYDRYIKKQNKDMDIESLKRMIRTMQADMNRLNDRMINGKVQEIDFFDSNTDIKQKQQSAIYDFNNAVNK
jgi:ABC-type Fe3+/spermidine/putrescine transport system ATPase subunit